MYGFRYDGLGVKAANWAMSPQSFNQDLAILKTYYSFLGPRGSVIVSLGPYSSCLKSYTDTEWLKYYTILHPGVMENFSLEQQEKAYHLKDHPFVYARKEMIHGFISYLKQKAKGQKELLTLDYQPMSHAEVEQNAQMFIEGWKRQFHIEDMDAPLPAHIKEGRKQRVETLKEMHRFCQDRELRMFVVLPPVTKALSSKFSPTFRENYIYSFLRESGIDNDFFFNYFDDEELSKEELYVNSMFMNRQGAKLFTKQILLSLNILK